MNKLLIICGPTATGKTQLAVALAKRFNGELVSADSRQVYKGLDILTGKDLPKKLRVPASSASRQNLEFRTRYGERSYVLKAYIVDHAPLWLYDVVSSRESFSVAIYLHNAHAVIDNIEARGKLPILVGGTGLYIRAVTKPIDTVSIPQDHSLRNKLGIQTVSDLQQILESLDPKKWEQMNTSDRSNPRRLMRAVEVTLWKQQHKSGKKLQPYQFDTLWIGLTASLENLKYRVIARVHDRWKNGAVDEVRQVVKDPSLLSKTASPLGLPTIRRYIEGLVTAQEAKLHWVQDEYNYAKRQLTWFRKEKRIHWFDVSDLATESSIFEMVKTWYTRGEH